MSGTPLCIFSTLEAGWNQSASSNSHCSRSASSVPTVDFPLPETPMTITIAGAGRAPSFGRVSRDISSLLPCRGTIREPVETPDRANHGRGYLAVTRLAPDNASRLPAPVARNATSRLLSSAG